MAPHHQVGLPLSPSMGQVFLRYLQEFLLQDQGSVVWMHLEEDLPRAFVVQDSRDFSPGSLPQEDVLLQVALLYVHNSMPAIVIQSGRRPA